MKKVVILLLINLLILSGCGSSGIPQSQFSQDEQVAYNFLKGIYSGDKGKQESAVSSYAGGEIYGTTIAKEYLDNGYFNGLYKDIKLIKLVNGTGKNKGWKSILADLNNNERSIEVIIDIKNHKVWNIYLSSQNKKGFENLKKSIF